MNTKLTRTKSDVERFFKSRTGILLLKNEPKAEQFKLNMLLNGISKAEDKLITKSIQKPEQTFYIKPESEWNDIDQALAMQSDGVRIGSKEEDKRLEEQYRFVESQRRKANEIAEYMETEEFKIHEIMVSMTKDKVKELQVLAYLISSASNGGSVLNVVDLDKMKKLGMA